MVDPRVERSRHAVLEAALGIICDEGYAHLTIDRVARRSGVARTTIYRHWDSVAEMLRDACTLSDAWGGIVPSASPRDDYVRLLRATRDALDHDDWGRLLPAVIDASRRDEQLAAVHEAQVAERVESALALGRRMVEAGELPEGTNLHLFNELIIGPVFFRALMLRESTSDEHLDLLIEHAMRAAAPAP